MTNDCNVWQPPVAKHCPITPLLVTTTNPHPPPTAVSAAPRKCPLGPSEGALIANADTCPSPRRRMWANNAPCHSCQHPHLSPQHPKPALTRTYPLSPPPTSPKRHVTADDKRPLLPTTPTRHVTAAQAVSPPSTIPRCHVTTENDNRTPRHSQTIAAHAV